MRDSVAKMKELGTAALALMMSKVSAEDVGLMAAISELTDGAVAKDATQAQCVAWWEANKQHWLIPFNSAAE
jgi:hypothetical protein